MFSFEGEFRRRPTQALCGADKNVLSRVELIRKQQEERRQRELERKKEESVVVIQSLARGFIARKRTARLLRESFDKTMSQDLSSGDIGSLITRLFCYYDEGMDGQRLQALSQVCLSKHQLVLASIGIEERHAWSKRLSDLLLANLRQSELKPGSLVLPLRLVEVYACSASSISTPLWLHLVNGGYFALIRHIIITRCPEIDEPCTKPPTPLAESLMQMSITPLTGCESIEDKSVVVRALLRDFFGYAGQSASLDCRIFYMALPLLSRCDQKVLPREAVVRSAQDSWALQEANSVWKLHALVTLVTDCISGLSNSTVIEYLSVIKVQLLDVLCSAPQNTRQRRRASSSDSDSDQEEDMDFVVHESVMQRTAIEAVWRLLNSEDHVQKVLKAVESTGSLEALIALSSVCYSMQSRVKHATHKCPLLYKLAFKPTYLHLLWTTLAAYRTGDDEKVSLLQMLSTGLRPSKTDLVAFVPLLISFCTLFGHLLPTIHEAEFYQEVHEDLPKSLDLRSSMMPFSLGELCVIATRLRDVALGLIELSFPEVRPSQMQIRDRTVQVDKSDCDEQMWLRLFESVVQLLHQLYSRDCRKKYCDNWIVNTMVVPEQVTDDNLKIPYVKRRPFAHLESRRREPSTQDSSLPPQTLTVELRTTTIIQELPFVIPFTTRVKIFHHLLRRDQTNRDNYRFDPLIRNQRMYNIRRNFLYEDAFEKLGPENTPSMRLPLRVQMMNTAGLEEAGVDGGGVFREFLNELLKTAFDVNRGFFKTTSDNLFYPNPSVQLIIGGDFHKHYYFIGRMLGKALYENMLVELPLAGFFLSKLLARQTVDLDIHHLASLDPVLYKNLLYLKSYEGDVSDFGLDFVVVSNEFGENLAVELKPGGGSIPVTKQNKIEYVHLVADYKLNKQIRQQTAYFKQGFADVIDPHWLQLFDPKELQILISGVATPIDVKDWRAHTSYGLGYTATHPVINNFWRVVEGLDEEEKRKLLKFATSCSRPPLLGFKELVPSFCINKAGSADRLPTSSTCINLLKLPEIEDLETMKAKLLYVIESGAGFELT